MNFPVYKSCLYIWKRNEDIFFRMSSRNSSMKQIQNCSCSFEFVSSANSLMTFEEKFHFPSKYISMIAKRFMSPWSPFFNIIEELLTGVFSKLWSLRFPPHKQYFRKMFKMRRKIARINLTKRLNVQTFFHTLHTIYFIVEFTAHGVLNLFHGRIPWWHSKKKSLHLSSKYISMIYIWESSLEWTLIFKYIYPKCC